MSNNLYQIITDKIIAQLDKGEIPWHRPWHGDSAGAINYVTRRPYSLLNQFLLEEPGEYLTFNQITERGGKIKKGSKSKMVVFYSTGIFRKKVVDPNTGEEKEKEERYPILKYYNVFALKDVEGIASKISTDGRHPENDPIPEAESITRTYIDRESKTGLSLTEDKMSNRAYYAPASDSIVVPRLDQFEESESFYATLFHEMTHSTGCEKRLNRPNFNSGPFGSPDYAREELVAEIGSAMLVGFCGIDTQKVFDNSIAYIQSWRTALVNDNHLIVTAAGKAEKAVDYILNGKEETVS